MNKKLAIYLLLAIYLIAIAFLIRYTNKSESDISRSNAIDSADVINIDEVNNNTSGYLNNEISVRGKVMFDSFCPPSEPDAQAKCTLIGYLVNPSETYLRPQTQKIALFNSDKWIQCTEPVANDNCDGWMINQTYDVTGKLIYVDGGGDISGYLKIEVSQKQQVK